MVETSTTSNNSRGQLKRLKKKQKALLPSLVEFTPLASIQLPTPVPLPDLGYDDKEYLHDEDAGAFAEIFAKFQLPDDELVGPPFPLPLIGR